MTRRTFAYLALMPLLTGCADNSSSVAQNRNRMSSASDIPPWWEDRDGMAMAPDGKSMLFVGNHPEHIGCNDLYLLDLVTNHVERLTNSPLSKHQPRFSHNGTMITYIQCNPLDADLPNNILCIFSLSDKKTHYLTDPKLELGLYKPAFSFDDTQIVVGGLYLEPNEYNNGSRLFLVPVTGGSLVPVVPDKSDGCTYGLFYDDHTILFQREEQISTPTDFTITRTVEALDTKTGARTVLPRLGEKTFLWDVEPGGTHILLGNSVTDPTPDNRFVMNDLHSAPYSVPALPPPSGPLFIVPSVDGKQTMVYYNFNILDVMRVPLAGGMTEQIADFRLFDDPLHWKPSTTTPAP